MQEKLKGLMAWKVPALQRSKALSDDHGHLGCSSLLMAVVGLMNPCTGSNLLPSVVKRDAIIPFCTNHASLKGGPGNAAAGATLI